MRLLLDTHIFLWYVGGNQRLKADVRAAIENAERVYLSVVSVWEATIKYHMGKLQLPEAPHPWLSVQRERHGIESLPVEESAVVHLSTLKAHHRDPFDRILICQAIEHRLQVVTVDPMIAKYPVNILTVE